TPTMADSTAIPGMATDSVLDSGLPHTGGIGAIPTRMDILRTPTTIATTRTITMIRITTATILARVAIPVMIMLAATIVTKILVAQTTTNVTRDHRTEHQAVLPALIT